MSSTTPPPPPPGEPTPSPAPQPEPPSGSRSFFARLFDLSFDEFVTPSLIKVIYVIGIVLAALVGLGVLIAFASEGGGAVVLGIILGPLVFFVYVLFARVLSEIYLILFKIEENTRR